MKLWIARDKFGGLYLHAEEPQRVEEHGYFRSINAMKLPMLEYREITWENSPQRVELKLCNTDFDRILEENKDVLKRIKENGD